ncbi:unnamed protein product [Rotaria sordida]|uniref:BEN domain-containing protein n=1 Tax=Rotaria sordida TaxID=392033 RepID=A0A815UPG8_9BILA|nr:unnamed protein product [Rotaria sordida]
MPTYSKRSSRSKLHCISWGQNAKKLGLSRDELNKILTTKPGITRVARALFQQIVPKELLQVDHWNDLDPYVLLKEKILIKFMERYYGPLQVERKKIHSSLVNCLRNERNVRKKTDQETCTSNNGEQSNNNEDMNQTTGCDDFNST